MHKGIAVNKRHTYWHDGTVSRADRNMLNQHKSGIVWFTGIPSSGKSTIAYLVDKMLHSHGARLYVLDGDNIRHGLCADLGFSREDRYENLRRIAEVSKLMVDAGIVVLAAFVSPYRSDRDFVRSSFCEANFIEVYVKCSVSECEKRDPKGNYKRAREGAIKNFTGISAPYEAPKNPDVVIDTERLSPDEAAAVIIDYLSEWFVNSTGTKVDAGV